LYDTNLRGVKSFGHGANARAEAAIDAGLLQCLQVAPGREPRSFRIDGSTREERTFLELVDATFALPST
jgi:hypothetical protein